MAILNSFQAHLSTIHRIKQSPFNTNTNFVATCSWDTTVKIWNVYTSFNWTLFRTYSNHSSSIYALEWLDNDTLASGGYSDQTIQIWSLTTGQTYRTINTNGNLNSLKLFNNKIHLAAGVYGGSGDINIYNINDGLLVTSFKGHASGVMDLAQISDDLLASSSGDYSIRIWNLTTNTCKFILTGHNYYVYGLKQITPNILASGSQDATVKLWDITSGQLISSLTNHTSGIFMSVDLLNSQTLVSGSLDQTIKLWNWLTGECLTTIQTNSNFYTLAVIVMNQQQQTSKFSFI